MDCNVGIHTLTNIYEACILGFALRYRCVYQELARNEEWPFGRAPRSLS